MTHSPENFIFDPTFRAGSSVKDRAFYGNGGQYTRSGSDWFRVFTGFGFQRKERQGAEARPNKVMKCPLGAKCSWGAKENHMETLINPTVRGELVEPW